MTRKEAVYQINQLAELSTNKEIPKITEALEMAIETLQGDMYCPNCGVRLVPEDEYLEPTQTHGRLIDADALSKKLCGTTIFIKDGEVFQRMINDAPTVQADRPHGEWIWDNNAVDWNLGAWVCSICHARNDNIPHSERIIPLRWSGSNFCPNCGADMRGDK